MNVRNLLIFLSRVAAIILGLYIAFRVGCWAEPNCAEMIARNWVNTFGAIFIGIFVMLLWAIVGAFLIFVLASLWPKEKERRGETRQEKAERERKEQELERLKDPNFDPLTEIKNKIN